MHKLLILLLALLFSSGITTSFAKSHTPTILEIGGAQLSLSFSEKESALDRTQTASLAPVTAKFSSPSMQVTYHFLTESQLTYYGRVVLPATVITDDSIFGIRAGLTYYFWTEAIPLGMRTENSLIRLTPNWKLYIFPEIGINLFNYDAQAVTISDTQFQLGLGLGFGYHFTSHWGITFEGSYAQAFGINTTGNLTTLNVGISYIFK